ncbi:MAG: sodium:alanine symporter family protein, partial [Magnetococcales bacterium]|nr:sodium:alanine symporter family protein [Magnetococcales bacterium]
MELIASWIWNPFLSLIYLEIGLVFLVITRAFAWRRAWRGFLVQQDLAANSGDKRQIGHLEGFLAGLAVSVGVGNLAGVGTAIHLGGPGALFWMWVSALVGASFRMSASYMAVKYRPESSGSILFGTPMAYLSGVLKGGSWRFLPALFAGLVLCKGMVAANLIQANSVAQSIQNDFGGSTIVVACLLALLVGAVVIGSTALLLMLAGILQVGLDLLLQVPDRVILILVETRQVIAVKQLGHRCFRQGQKQSQNQDQPSH